MASGAPDTVFRTYELLENVLLHLPVRDVLLTQRINKACYDVIQRSQDIKRALFLAPAAQVCHSPRDNRLIFNPFIKMSVLTASVFPTNAAKANRKHLLKGEDAVLISAGIRVRPDRPRHYFACQRGAMLGLKRRSRDSMLVSYPPVRRASLADPHRAAGRPAYDLVYNTMGVTYKDLIFCASHVWQMSWKKTPGMYYLEDADAWLQFAGTIDSITAHEMLEMLEMSAEELLRKGLAFHEKTGGFDN